MAETVTMPKHQMMARVIQASFHNWAKNSETYGKLYAKMPPELMDVINVGLSEVAEYTPFQWDLWWLKNHNRFRRIYRQEDMKIMVQIIYAFLCLHARGKIGESLQGTRRKAGKTKT
jgi:hypothetical protein